MKKTVEGAPAMALSSVHHPLLTRTLCHCTEDDYVGHCLRPHCINFNCYKENVNNSRTMSKILDAFLIYLASVH